MNKLLCFAAKHADSELQITLNFNAKAALTGADLRTEIRQISVFGN
jgi:hypothetical protein